MNIITKLNIRQKVMLVLTILAAVFLAWQIYNFVHGATAPTRPVPVVAAPGTGTPVTALAGSLPPPVVQQLPTNLDNSSLTPRQQEYLNLVREYQITKMKRQILEEQANLASAQKRIADAAKGGGLTAMNTLPGDSNWASQPTGDYQLAYLDRQAGRWTATLSQGEQYTQVRVGTKLGDGSRVVSITNQGVVLQPIEGKNITLAFQGSVNDDNDSTPGYTVSSHLLTRRAANLGVGPKPNNAQIAKMLA